MNRIRWTAGVSALEGERIVQEVVSEQEKEGILKLGEDLFRFKLDPREENGFCSMEAESSGLSGGRFFLAAELPDYREDWFIMIPSVCYDGNRFRMQKIEKYPPVFLEHVFPEDPMHPEIIMKEIPALGDDFNRMITDGSAPLIGIFMPESQQAFFLLLEQDTLLGNNGIELEITQESALKILISMPCVRRRIFTSYRHLDTAPDLTTGKHAELHFQTKFLPAPDIRSFYRCFAQIRNSFPSREPLQNRRAFSHAEKILRNMFEEVRWNEKCNFYTKARNQSRIDAGWVTFPELPALFHEGTPQARLHVLKQLDHFFTQAQLESGFFLTCSLLKEDQILWKTKNDFKELVRQQSEILFYALRLLHLFELEHVAFPEDWKNKLRKLAGAMQDLWKKNQQFGFMLDLHTGSLQVGGSFSGALAPAALVFAAEYFHEESFLHTAEEAAGKFCEELHKRGFTYGGPGDALFSPDSESAFSLLESLVILYEKTRDPEWLCQAEFCADYCSSWVPAVRYKFPAGSTLDQLDTDCRGAVQANLQNQHGAPAPCIGSANALFRLYLYTGRSRHLEMLRDIVHNCVQYLSTENHPIPIVKTNSFVPPGDICEKVYFQDHGNSMGKIPFGSGGWTEIAVLLCITENPGVYFDFEKGVCSVIDHVEADLTPSGLRLKNPFDYPVTLRLWNGRNNTFSSGPVFLPFRGYETVHLEAHGSIQLDKDGKQIR